MPACYSILSTMSPSSPVRTQVKLRFLPCSSSNSTWALEIQGPTQSLMWKDSHLDFRCLVQDGHPLCGNPAIPSPVGASSMGCIRGRMPAGPAFFFTNESFFTTTARGNTVITGDLSEVPASTVTSALSLCLTYLLSKRKKKITKAKSPPNPVISSHKTTKPTVLDA